MPTVCQASSDEDKAASLPSEVSHDTGEAAVGYRVMMNIYEGPGKGCREEGGPCKVLLTSPVFPGLLEEQRGT